MNLRLMDKREFDSWTYINLPLVDYLGPDLFAALERHNSGGEPLTVEEVEGVEACEARHRNATEEQRVFWDLGGGHEHV